MGTELRRADARFRDRASATVIDLVSLWAVGEGTHFGLAYAGAALWANYNWTPDSYVATFQTLGWAIITVQIAYIVVAEAVMGQTWGKRVVGIEVVSSRDTPLRTRHIIARRAAQPLLMFLPTQIVFAVATGSYRPRPLHDSVSGTNVVPANSERARSPWSYVRELARRVRHER